MSCNEWERGEIKIPSAEWTETKKKIREAWNREQDRLFEKAKAIYEKIKGKKVPQPIFGHPLEKEFEAAPHFLFREKEPDERGRWILRDKMRRPTRSDFPHATNRTTVFNDEYVDVAFNNKNRIVVWDVIEGNRVCEDARKSNFGSAVLRILSNVKYTKGSGGEIVGNDEYNQESRHEGGGANYVKDTFGPNMNKPQPYTRDRGYGPFGLTAQRW